MLVQIKKKIPGSVVKAEFASNGVQIGNRFYTHDYGPFDVDQKKAAELIKGGFADAVIIREESTAQKAVAPRSEAQRR